MTDRFEQEIGLVKYFQTTESQRQGRVIGEDEALNLFISEGYAARYADVYSDEISMEKLKEKLFG